MAFDGMTPEQASTFKNLAEMRLCIFGLVGLDAEDRPVVRIRDQRREFCMGIRWDGAGRDPVQPLRWFTDDEVVNMSEADSSLLFSVPLADHPQPTEEAQ